MGDDKITLGKMFWRYQAGQAISILGNICTDIACAVWILDKSSSSIVMAGVVYANIFNRDPL